MTARSAKKLDAQNRWFFPGLVAAWFSLLSLINTTHSAVILASALLLFCLIMQGMFGIMHECFHNLGQSSARQNYWLGCLATCLFGSCYSLIRANHIGHHRYNRSDRERVDYITPQQSRLGKTIFYYSAILGGIWLTSFLMSLCLPFIRWKWVQAWSRQPGVNSYIETFSTFSERRWQLLKIESLVNWLFWLALMATTHWHWSTLPSAYAAFCFSWSSLQWVYHMRSPLHRIEGAYNLRVPSALQFLMLNLNCHLTHHRHPRAHWQDLPRLTNWQGTDSLLRRYLLVFRPPMRLETSSSLCD